MKKFLLLFITVALFSGITMAQDTEKIAKPAALSHATTDHFVDEAFAIYDKVYAIEAKLVESEPVVADLETKAEPTADEIKVANASLLESTTKLEALQGDVTTLLGKFDNVLKQSKTITPKTKMPKAAKALNKSKKALISCKDKIPAQIKVASGQKARLETVKAINK